MRRTGRALAIGVAVALASGAVACKKAPPAQSGAEPTVDAGEPPAEEEAPAPAEAVKRTQPAPEARKGQAPATNGGLIEENDKN